MIESTRARTDPIQSGYHPINVKKIVGNRVANETVTAGFFPRVDITITIKIPIVKASENIIPASVCVVPRESAILLSQSDQTTIVIR